jgi:hypothetical protein
MIKTNKNFLAAVSGFAFLLILAAGIAFALNLSQVEEPHPLEGEESAELYEKCERLLDGMADVDPEVFARGLHQGNRDANEALSLIGDCLEYRSEYEQYHEIE